jgi:hypothetical protein
MYYHDDVDDVDDEDDKDDGYLYVSDKNNYYRTKNFFTFHAYSFKDIVKYILDNIDYFEKQNIF